MYPMTCNIDIYYRMDVYILQCGWRIFRETCLKLTGGQLDPLIGRYFTLASFAAAAYKTLHMNNPIGIIPWGGSFSYVLN